MAQITKTKMNKSSAVLECLHQTRDGKDIRVNLTVEKNDVPFIKKLADDGNLAYDVSQNHFYTIINNRHLLVNRLVAKRNIKVPSNKNVKYLEGMNNIRAVNLAV